KEKLRCGSRASLASKRADGKRTTARSNCGSESEVKTGTAISIASSFAFSSDSEKSVGPSTGLFARISAKKKDFRRASPTTQYSCASHFIAEIEGKPIKPAPEETCNPIAAEIAMRVPAYEPGPSPTIIVSGAPNFSVTARRL